MQEKQKYKTIVMHQQPAALRNLDFSGKFWVFRLLFLWETIKNREKDKKYLHHKLTYVILEWLTKKHAGGFLGKVPERFRSPWKHEMPTEVKNQMEVET